MKKFIQLLFIIPDYNYFFLPNFFINKSCNVG